jgi:hypothetical protein
MTKHYHCHVKDGCLHIHDRAVFDEQVKSMEGKDVALTLGLFRHRRSDQQNRYYWGVVIKLLGDHFGYEPEEMHDALKLKFLFQSGMGKPDTIRSSKKLNITEFMEYIDSCIRFAAEHGVIVPDAGEDGPESFEDAI